MANNEFGKRNLIKRKFFKNLFIFYCDTGIVNKLKILSNGCSDSEWKIKICHFKPPLTKCLIDKLVKKNYCEYDKSLDKICVIYYDGLAQIEKNKYEIHEIKDLNCLEQLLNDLRYY